ncbi:hypothetical protein [Spirosoma sordidisoli]|nr:hypothetical protein [Spirosoma sordidisoli]
MNDRQRTYLILACIGLALAALACKYALYFQCVAPALWARH